MAGDFNDGVGVPPMLEGMNKGPPKPGDDTPDGAKTMTDDRKESFSPKKKKKGEKSEDQKIIDRAMKRWKKANEAESDNRTKALEDLKFKAGEQWPSDIAAKRNNEKRPCLTINSAPTLTHQVINDIRQNRPAINISPLGDQANKDSAELMASYIRAVERDSAAEIAYDTACQYAVDIGFGYWRILTEFASSKTFDQVPIVRRIRNPFTVLLDPMRQEPDGSDSGYGFISEMMDRSEFEDQWPDAIPLNWRATGVGEAYRDWVTKDQIRIVEYFEVQHHMRRLVELDTGHIGWYDDLSTEVLDQIARKKVEIVNSRDADQQTVMWYKMTAAEILERSEWLGKWIPIVEVVGEELDLEGKVIRSGIIRNAKDPMRMKNYWATVKAELIALQPKAPFIGVEGQFEGFEDEWKRSGTDTLAYLEYAMVNDDQGRPMGPPTRSPPPAVPAGMIEAEQGAEQDILRTTGVRFDATKQERLFDESGKAIQEIRRNTDIGSFHYVDNFGRSLRHSGRILIDLIPKLITKARKVPALAENGDESRILIDPDHNRPTGTIPNGPNQPPMKVVNPTLGEYGVTVTIGPSYATKRIEASEQMMQFAARVPEPMRGVVATLIAKYSDWPGSTELYKALVKLSPPGIFEADPANMPPEAAAIIKGLQQQLKQLMGERTQMLRDLTDKQADRAVMTKKIDQDFEAKLMKIIADLTKFDKKFSLDVAASLTERLAVPGEDLPAGNTGQGGNISIPPQFMGS